MGREKPAAGRALHESDGFDDALDDGQSRGRLRLSVEGNGDQRRALRYAADYNWKSRIWDRNADLNLEGVRTLIKVVAEQGILKEPLPEPSKYIDLSYLNQALAEIGKK